MSGECGLMCRVVVCWVGGQVGARRGQCESESGGRGTSILHCRLIGSGGPSGRETHAGEVPGRDVSSQGAPVVPIVITNRGTDSGTSILAKVLTLTSCTEAPGKRVAHTAHPSGAPPSPAPPHLWQPQPRSTSALTHPPPPLHPTSYCSWAGEATHSGSMPALTPKWGSPKPDGTQEPNTPHSAAGRGRPRPPAARQRLGRAPCRCAARRPVVWWRRVG